MKIKLETSLNSHTTQLSALHKVKIPTQKYIYIVICAQQVSLLLAC